jgi:hypothetical protein
LTALESGQRMIDIDKNGERSFIDDAERAKRIKENQNMVAQNCK